MLLSSFTTDQRHGYGILQRTHAFPQRVLHCALLVQRRKRHVPNSSNVSNGAGASTAPTNSPHCKNHLLPTPPIHVGCAVKNCVGLPHKTASPLNNARMPQVMTVWQRTLCNILVHLRQRPLSQRQPASRTMRIRYPSNACRACRAKISKPKQQPTLLQH